MSSIEAEPIVNFKALNPITKDLPWLEHVSYIHYPIRFKKDQVKVKALIDFGNKFNTITLKYVAKLGLKIWPTDNGAQKIDNSTLEMFDMVLASFQVEDKYKRAWFFIKPS